MSPVHHEEHVEHSNVPPHAIFPKHQGFLENFADKGVKRFGGFGLMAIGALMVSHPVIGAGLLAYAAGDMAADFLAKIKRRSKKGMFPEHEGPFEQTMDKGVKLGLGFGTMAIGALMLSHPVVGFGLLAYAAGDMAADFAAKARRGNTPVLSTPGKHSH